jgi:hypothetical protein
MLSTTAVVVYTTTSIYQDNDDGDVFRWFDNYLTPWLSMVDVVFDVFVFDIYLDDSLLMI